MRLRTAIIVTEFIVFAATAGVARADNFISAHYDAQADALVVTMQYLGTNPNHSFTVQWGQCRQGAEANSPQQIVAVVADDQWKDAARTSFKKTVRFALAGVSCRPATVTLQTAPRFQYVISIPQTPAAKP